VKPIRHRKQDNGAIVGAIIGVAVISAAIGGIVFVQRRRRQARPRSVLSSSSPTIVWETGLDAIVTPFNPHLKSPEGAHWQDTGNPPEQQPLVYKNSDAEMVASRRLSSSPPAIPPLPQPVVPVPVGLSDKEMARLRAQNLSSQPPQTRSTSNVSQPQAETSTSPANSATGPDETSSSSYDTRRLHSEVESLRREMERLRSEGLVAEAPPGYTEGGR
jgi:hypothetical protein